MRAAGYHSKVSFLSRNNEARSKRESLRCSEGYLFHLVLGILFFAGAVVKNFILGFVGGVAYTYCS
ncbi:hypothetical protein BDW02DRAFT_569238 [Decorospora gaudefroyi]|uniref:Uncharacterized protein n=1 Tax=Decorospora gaudefroyi TaxID=184978 RepID=A0A6A5KFC3_9PLEO|nr:hypothetical protein BDW02DRAFT_569238 [Decorospora gaudefroyi]